MATSPREDPTYASARRQALRFWLKANAACWAAVAVFALSALVSDDAPVRWAFGFFVLLALVFAVGSTLGAWSTWRSWRRIAGSIPVETFPGMGLGPTGGTPDEHTVKMSRGVSPADPGALFLHVTIPPSMGAAPLTGAVTVQIFGRTRSGELRGPFVVVSADGSTRWWIGSHHVSRIRRPKRAEPSSPPV